MSGVTARPTSPARAAPRALLARIGRARRRASASDRRPRVRPRVRPADLARRRPAASTRRSCSARSWALFELADGAGIGAARGTRASTRRWPTTATRPSGSVVETNCEDSPFLVDSVSEELSARGLEIRLVDHPVIGDRARRRRAHRAGHACSRGAGPRVGHALRGRAATSLRRSSRELEARIRLVLGDVQAAVRDFEAMRDRVPRDDRGGARERAPATRSTRSRRREPSSGGCSTGTSSSSATASTSSPTGKLVDRPGRRARDPGRRRAARATRRRCPSGAIEPGLRERLVGGNLLVVSKTNRFATVHRRAKMDDITVKRVDDRRQHGRAPAVARHLHAQGVHGAGQSKTPILGRKLRQIAVAEDLLEGSHDHKALVELFESFPKDELFAAGPEELRQTARSPARPAGARAHPALRPPAPGRGPRLRAWSRFRATASTPSCATGSRI